MTSPSEKGRIAEQMYQRRRGWEENAGEVDPVDGQQVFEMHLSPMELQCEAWLVASDTVWASGREQQHSVEYGKVVVQRTSSVNRRSVLSEYAAG